MAKFPLKLSKVEIFCLKIENFHWFAKNIFENISGVWYTPPGAPYAATPLQALPWWTSIPLVNLDSSPEKSPAGANATYCENVPSFIFQFDFRTNKRPDLHLAN